LNDLLAALAYHPDGENKLDAVMKHLCELARWELDFLRRQQLHPSELQDVATQKFRVHAIHLMVSAVAKAFRENYESITSGSFDGELIKVSEAARLCSALKKFDRENAFGHKSVLEIELNGYNVLNRLMDFLWVGISQRKSFDDLASDRTTPFAAYVYSRISKNYRRMFEGKVDQYHPDPKLPIRYKEMQLLADMVSGMTDQFCIDLYRDFEHHYREMRRVDGTRT
ncbi:MAG: deoxyguanosinetriphosphate triphosphohydrolase, partial [Pseudomonadota bacterium]